VDTILSALPPNALRLSSPVCSVRTLESGKVLLTTANGSSEEYNHVIMACHADASLEILKAGGGLTGDEEKILGGFQWNKNVAVIHSDPKACIRTLASSRFPDS
jgi:predicted NAD/FAD-binding protein